MPNNRKQLFLAKPRPGETAAQFADRVMGQLRAKGILGEDGKLAPEVLEAGEAWAGGVEVLPSIPCSHRGSALNLTPSSP